MSNFTECRKNTHIAVPIQNEPARGNPECADPQPSAQRLYTLHLFRNTFARCPVKSVQLTAKKLLRFLVTHRATETKEAAGLFSGVEYSDPTKECRKLAGISAVHLIVGDIDGGFSQDKFNTGCAALRAASLTAVAYQTYGSKPEAQRWRVVVLLDEPIPPSAYRQCWDGLNAAFGGTLDSNAKDAGRLSYLPSHPPGETREALVIEGAQ